MLPSITSFNPTLLFWLHNLLCGWKNETNYVALVVLLFLVACKYFTLFIVQLVYWFFFSFWTYLARLFLFFLASPLTSAHSEFNFFYTRLNSSRFVDLALWVGIDFFNRHCNCSFCSTASLLNNEWFPLQMPQCSQRSQTTMSILYL